MEGSFLTWINMSEAFVTAFNIVKSTLEKADSFTIVGIALIALQFLIFWMCVSWRQKNREMKPHALNIREKLDLFKLRCEYLKRTLHQGKQLMKKREFESAVFVFNLGIDDATENGTDQIQSLRNVWAELHEMKARCYSHLGDILLSQREIDSALRVARYPGGHLVDSANHVFQLFRKWCLRNANTCRDEVLEYFDDKYERLMRERTVGFAYPYLLIELTHCLLLADLLKTTGLSDQFNDDLIKDIRLDCEHIWSSLPFLNDVSPTVPSSSSSSRERLNSQSDSASVMNKASKTEQHNRIKSNVKAAKPSNSGVVPNRKVDGQVSPPVVPVCSTSRTGSFRSPANAHESSPVVPVQPTPRNISTAARPGPSAGCANSPVLPSPSRIQEQTIADTTGAAGDIGSVLNIAENNKPQTQMKTTNGRTCKRPRNRNKIYKVVGNSSNLPTGNQQEMSEKETGNQNGETDLECSTGAVCVATSEPEKTFQTADKFPDKRQPGVSKFPNEFQTVDKFADGCQTGANKFSDACQTTASEISNENQAMADECLNAFEPSAFTFLPPGAISIFANDAKGRGKDKKPRSSSIKLFAELYRKYRSICLACDICLVVGNAGTNRVKLQTYEHECLKNRLVIFEKDVLGNDSGMLVRLRPWSYNPILTPGLCESASAEEACIEKQRCAFPHNELEKILWKRDYHKEISLQNFTNDLSRSFMFMRHFVAYLRKKFSGEFKLVCQKCLKDDGKNGLKNRHVPECRTGHGWEANKILVFELQDSKELIMLDGQPDDPESEYCELFDCVASLTATASAQDIADECRRLQQQKESGKRGEDLDWEEGYAADEQEDGDEDSSQARVINPETGEDAFDTDCEDVLDLRAFDEDSGDIDDDKDAEKEANSRFEPYYQLVKDYSENMENRRKGKIHLIGARDAVCTLEDGSEIRLSGRMNCGPAFDGDEVVVELRECKSSGIAGNQGDGTTGRQNVQRELVRGTVVAVTKRNTHRVARTFVCVVDKYRSNLMRPLCGTAPKFHVLDTELERKYGRDKKIDYVAVQAMTEKGLKMQKAIRMNPKSREEMLFVVKYLKWNPRHMYPLGYVCKVIRAGHDEESSINVLNLLYEIQSKEPDNCLESIAEYQGQIKKEIEEKRAEHADFGNARDEIGRRVDLTQRFTLSIDPPGCRDVDDALSVERRQDDLFKVWVHIADVGSFVQKNDPVDRASKRRAMSYYPRKSSKAIHMLHSKLATDLFSLKQGQTRCAVSVVYVMDSNGVLRGDPEVIRSLVQNDKKMTYDEVQEIIDDDGKSDPTELDEIVIFLHRLAKKLRATRLATSQFYYDYDIQSFLTNEGIGNPFAVDQHHDAHRLVEEFMILTNKTIANYLLAKFPREIVPLRQQCEPSRAKVTAWYSQFGNVVDSFFYFGQLRSRDFFADLDELVDFDDENGVDFDDRRLAVLKSSWDALLKAVKNNDARMVRTIVGSEKLHPIHSLALNEWFQLQEFARFDPATTDSKHFGLQMPHYVQFTSPIRRFMDVIVHRLVAVAIDARQSPPDLPYTASEIQELCDRLNLRVSAANSYSRSCAVVRMATLLKKPFYLPCFVEKFDLYGVAVKTPYFRQRQQRSCDIKYSSLSVNEIPKNKDEKTVVLSWQKRFYDTKGSRATNARSTSDTEMSAMLSSELHGKSIRHCDWKLLQDAIVSSGSDQALLPAVRDVVANVGSVEDVSNSVLEVTSEMQVDDPLVKHHVSFSLQLQRGSVLAVQFGKDVIDGFMQPDVRLVNLTNGKDICVEHQIKPVKCFAAVGTKSVKQYYEDITNYQEVWLPILHMESATNAVVSENPIMCNHVPVKLRKLNNMFLGQLELDRNFIRVRHIKVPGISEQETETYDYLCIRYHWGEKYPQSLIRNVWVCHAVVLPTNVDKSKRSRKSSPEKIIKKNKPIVLNFRLWSYGVDPPEDLLTSKRECTVEFLYRTLPDKRMAKAVESLLSPEASELCRRIALGVGVSNMKTPQICQWKPAHSFDIDGIVVAKESKFLKNNKRQEEAIRKSLNERFTLVQGPPGTGKTLIGVKIAYWFVQKNLMSNPAQEEENDLDSEDDEEQAKNAGQVLFCGPSNSSVDVAAKQLVTRLGNKCPRIVRVYGEMREAIDFPIPRDLLITKSEAQIDKHRRNLQYDPVIKKISLHRIIREAGKPYSKQILYWDREFAKNMKTPQNITDDQISYYQKLITNASVEELKNYDIILCTCSASECKRLTRGARIKQIIIDECAMCMEPDSLIPLTTFPSAQQVVLIGDHKQLQPIIINQEAKKLGLNISLFQRYADSNMANFVMLNIQYRMNEKICEFPSEYFYDGKLETARNSRWFQKEDHFLTIWPSRFHPMVFCHVEGVEVSQPVATAEGNEESRSNAEEQYHVIRIATELINTLRIANKYDSKPDKNIAILSQYKAQCSAVKDRLSKNGLECNVSTVVASQGDEWDYVILSTVRSLPEYEIDKNPSDGWCLRNLGFICDEHQINVALTRARMGLIIVGNKHLLKCNQMWDDLIRRYESHGSVLNAEDFLKTAIIPGYAEHMIPRLSRKPRVLYSRNQEYEA